MLNKIASYLGLALAIAIAYLLLHPLQSVYRGATDITPLDNDATSQIIQEASQGNILLLRIARFIHECPQLENTPNNQRCYYAEYAPDFESIFQLQDDIAPLLKDGNAKYQKYFDSFKDKSINSDLPQEIMTVYPQLLDKLTASYKATVYIVHVLLLLLLAGIVYWRKNVGLFLINIVRIPLKLMFKGAGELHKKV